MHLQVVLDGASADPVPRHACFARPERRVSLSDDG
jgi:hypothetical protein